MICERAARRLLRSLDARRASAQLLDLSLAVTDDRCKAVFRFLHELLLVGDLLGHADAEVPLVEVVPSDDGEHSQKKRANDPLDHDSIHLESSSIGSGIASPGAIRW